MSRNSSFVSHVNFISVLFGLVRGKTVVDIPGDQSLYIEDDVNASSKPNEGLNRLYILVCERFQATPYSLMQGEIKSVDARTEDALAEISAKNTVDDSRIIVRNTFRSKKTGVQRLAKSAISTLTRWLVEHQGDPYPTNETKKSLAFATGLTYTNV